MKQVKLSDFTYIYEVCASRTENLYAFKETDFRASLQLREQETIPQFELIIDLDFEYSSFDGTWLQLAIENISNWNQQALVKIAKISVETNFFKAKDFFLTIILLNEQNSDSKTLYDLPEVIYQQGVAETIQNKYLVTYLCYKIKSQLRTKKYNEWLCYGIGSAIFAVILVCYILWGENLNF